jgi:hypothetical protein
MVVYPDLTTQIEILGSEGNLRVEDASLDYLHMAQPGDPMGDYGNLRSSSRVYCPLSRRGICRTVGGLV